MKKGGSKMNKKILSYLTILFLVVLTNTAESVAFLATITKVEGKVEVQKAKTKGWINAEIGMRLAEGDKIKTGAKSEAVIKWDDETMVKISSFTNFVINKSTVNPETKTENINLSLFIGRLTSKVKKILTSGSSFEIQTPSAIAGVRSTIWSTLVKGDGETIVSTQEGEVMVSAEGTLVIVGKGKMTRVKPKKPPSPPEEQSEEEKKFWEEERDITAPRLTVDKPLDGEETESEKITVSGTTSPDVSLLINGVGVNPDAFGKFEMEVILKEGENRITITATNPAGKTITVTRKIKYKKKVAEDTTPPEILINQPQDGTITNQNNIVVSGVTEKDAKVSVNNIPTSVNIDGSFSQNISLIEGRNTINITSQDKAGNIATKSLSIILDTTPPLLSITSPDKKIITNQTTLQLSGITEPGASVTVAGVDISVNSDGTFSRVINLREGINSLKVEAKDRAGNTAVAYVEVILDTVPPQLIITSPVENFVTSSPTVLLQGITERGAKVFVDGKEVSVDSGGNFSTQILVKEGINSLKIEAKDIAGNVTAVTRRVKFEITPLFLQAVIREKETMRELGDYSKTSRPEIVIYGFTKPGAKAYVNFKEVYVYPDGHFEEKIILREGINTLNISAEDSAGNRQEIVRKISYVSIPPLPPQEKK